MSFAMTCYCCRRRCRRCHSQGVLVHRRPLHIFAERNGHRTCVAHKCKYEIKWLNILEADLFRSLDGRRQNHKCTRTIPYAVELCHHSLGTRSPYFFFFLISKNSIFNSCRATNHKLACKTVQHRAQKWQFKCFTANDCTLIASRYQFFDRIIFYEKITLMIFRQIRFAQCKNRTSF